MSTPVHFDFFVYRDNIIAMLTAEFPILEEVIFKVSTDGDDRQWADIGVPAFIINYEPVQVLGSGMDGTTDDGFYLNIKVNLCGYLLVPRFPDADANLNMYLARCQAGTNIASHIFAKARGWNCEIAEIESIEFDDSDDAYHVAIVKWGHHAVVGRDKTYERSDVSVFGKFLPCPDSNAEDELVVEGVPLDLESDDQA